MQATLIFELAKFNLGQVGRVGVRAARAEMWED